MAQLESIKKIAIYLTQLPIFLSKKMPIEVHHQWAFQINQQLSYSFFSSAGGATFGAKASLILLTNICAVPSFTP